MNSAALAAAAARSGPSLELATQLGSQLVGSFAQARNLADSLEHRRDGESVADLDALAVLEVVDDRAQLAEIEMSGEDILDRFVDDAMDQLVFVTFFLGHRELELAARARHGERQVGRPRHDPPLAMDDRSPLGVGDDVFQVGDRHPDRDAGLLVHVRRAMRASRAISSTSSLMKSGSPGDRCPASPRSSHAFWSLIAMPISRDSG